MARTGNPSTPPPTTELQEDIVKQILSGDSIILRGYPKGGPPPEKTVNLAYLQAPKISKRIPLSGQPGLKREILSEPADPQKLVGQTYNGIVEHVISGSTLRVAVEVQKLVCLSSLRPLTKSHVLTITLTGIKVPNQGEEFGAEAKFFTESLLLHRDVKITINAFNQSKNRNQSKNSSQSPSFSASVICNSHDIAEDLLVEGMATCMDWTLATLYSNKLRAAESEAKKKKLRLWKDYNVVKTNTEQWIGKVQEIINGDALMIENVETKDVKKIFLASVRPPPRPEGDGKVTRVTLYDVRFMFEAREFLRTRLIGKEVKVVIDYIQPKSEQCPEKTCASVFTLDENMSTQNVGEALIAEGLATAVRYCPDDESRSSCYDALRDAEDKAQTKKLGIHGNPKKGILKKKRRAVVVTQVAEDLSHIFAQFAENGPAFDALMTELREELTSNPPLPGAYTPKKGDVVAAKFSGDGQWYRVRIDKIAENKKVEVTYIDYGNKELLPSKDLAPLPDSKYSLASFPEATKKFGLAFVTLPGDKEVIDDTRKYFEEQAFSCGTLLLLVAYTATGLDYVTLVDPGSKKDIVLQMVESGLFIINNRRRRERKLHKVQSDYRTAQENAKKNRLNLWQYGDFTEDDAREFGLGR